MGYSPDVETTTVITTVVTNAIAGPALLLLFEAFRSTREIFSPRYRTDRDRTPSLPEEGIGKWITAIEKINDEDMLGYIGLDAFMFLRFLGFCSRVSVFSAGIGMIFLWPIYYTSNGHQDGVAGVNLYTMANVEPNGNRLYASVMCCWVFTLFFLTQIEVEYKQFIKLRQEFLLVDDPRLDPQQKLTVMVENIPPGLQSPAALKELFETIFPGVIANTSIAFLTTELEEQIQIRESILTELEIALAHEKSSPQHEKKQIRINRTKNEPTLFCGENVDAIDFYTQKLETVNSAIRAIYEKAASRSSTEAENPLSNSFNSKTHLSLVDKKVHSAFVPGIIGISTNTGFVTFSSRAACLSAYRLGTLFDSHPEIHVSPVGSLTEIIWSNLHYSTDEMRDGKGIEQMVFRTGLLFWSTILTLIAAISNLNNLEKYLPFLSSLDPTTYSLLSGLLPVAVMGYFISLLPVVFAYGGMKWSKLKTKSHLQEDVFHWMYYYQIANVFVTTFSGSVFDSIVALIDNPTSVIGLLGASLPAASVFFGNFTLSAAIIGGATELLQIGPLLIYLFYTKILKEPFLTRRQILTGPLAPQTMNYGEYLPAILFILFLFQIYWVMSPLTTLFATIYFLSKYLILKYQFLYLFTPQFEMGAVFWFELFRYSMVGLFTSSITMLGYTALKEGQIQLALLFPLPFVVWWWWGKMVRQYEHLAKDIPFSCAVQIDQETLRDPSRKDLTHLSSDHYKQPCLTSPIEAGPLPYRIDNLPLFDSKGQLNEVYASKIVEVDLEKKSESSTV